MLDELKRLLSPEYLVVPEPGPLGGMWVLYAALGFLFAACLVYAARVLYLAASTAPPQGARRLAGRRIWAWCELWVSLAGLATVLGRFLAWPGWSARVWPYTLALLDIAGLVAYRFRAVKLAPRLASASRMLALLPSSHSEATSVYSPRDKTRYWFWLGLTVHLLGVGMVLRVRYGMPYWAAPLVLLVVLLPQAPLLRYRRRPRLLPVAPLLAAYAITLLWLFYRSLGITVIAWQGIAFPNPLVSLLYVDGVILAAVVLALLCQAWATLEFLGRPSRLWRWVAAGLLAVTLAWAVTVYFGKRTHGATASDPYAYAQMGVDLALHGTFLHRYSLFEAVIPLNIAWAPLQPVGYHIPRNSLGDCPSVWATGDSVLLAAGYRLLGEVGLYVTTPFIALLALATAWALAMELLRNEPRAVRLLTAALTVALLATSPEFVDRLLVPMADAAAQLFTSLTFLFILRGMRQLGENRRRAVGSLILAGVAFGWAYWVRHTQLLLVVPAAVAAACSVRRRKTGTDVFASAWPWLVFLCAAVAAALPDIVYRWRVFGGLLATETTELPAMGIQNVSTVAWELLRSSLVAGEWGYLFPLALYGVVRLTVQHRRALAVLGSGFIAIVLVHLTYRFLRLRDLIVLFPLVDLAVAYGAVSLVREVRLVVQRSATGLRLGHALLSVGITAWIVLGLALSRWAMIDDLWKPGWSSFGYVQPDQRAAFERLAELTPPDAVIGASLNAGAVMMYTGRDAIRPYDSWTDSEWDVFLEAMQRSDRPVYLLDDGAIMARFIDQERARSRLTAIEALRIPLFDAPARRVGWLYRLEWQP